MLSETQIAAFVRDGFVRVSAAVPRATVEACVEVIWDRLAEHGVSRTDRSSWSSPVVRIDCPEDGADGEPFAAAGTSPALWEAYDQLIGPDRWWKRQGVGGTVPVRLPSREDPGDAGWHVESSFPVGDSWHTNVRSRDRGLLALFLFTDVGPDDAPTRVRVGSHVDAARVLAQRGDEGFGGVELSPLVRRASADRPVAHVTGAAGDVYLCHPFLVHAASWPHLGTTPRIMAQPGVALLGSFALADRENAYPVEATIMDAIMDAIGTPAAGIPTR
ncbi:phytanoyl-CoA dioxygenase family protein [Actinopolymorpha singaporensis]|uniref:Phytanoyl-CoA dioxygenase (PhyH) n=1 Tax=Actinopolymorpha singaporensis TaxID=117157 RepID=A0A1H1P278_9ACTN|nr:phytanoyl-CoA dioxygenase family protein [Actinopolymorpha singaporensis]SDS05358.1 Phytanoyl-CoA dioxygenase (PhyH) [Actinopolymorpha singaporensis]